MSTGWPETPHSIHRLWKNSWYKEGAQQWDLGPRGTVLRRAVCHRTYRRAALPASWSSRLLARDSQRYTVCTSVSPKCAWGSTWDHATSLVHRQPGCCSDLCSKPEWGLPLPQHLCSHWRWWVRQNSHTRCRRKWIESVNIFWTVTVGSNVVVFTSLDQTKRKGYLVAQLFQNVRTVSSIFLVLLAEINRSDQLVRSILCGGRALYVRQKTCKGLRTG